MAKEENIIKVQFIRSINGQYEFNFGSLAAIYDKFTPAEIGCTLQPSGEAVLTSIYPKQQASV